jgi:hypothetical protein
MISDVRRIKDRELWDGVPRGPIGAGGPQNGNTNRISKIEERCLITKLIF